MFKFLFGKRKEAEVVVETQRETFVRLVEELNEAIDALSDKPRVTLDPASGHLSFELPEQFPDEALALPAPEDEPAEEKPAEEEVAEDTTTEPEEEKGAA